MLLVWPIFIPFFTAVIALLLYRSPEMQRGISLAGAVALLVAGSGLLIEVIAEGTQTTQMGGWPAPFGITLIADLLSAGMVVVTALIGLAVLVFGLGDLTAVEEKNGQYPLTHCLLAGLSGAFLTGDLFNMYVWFEVMLISSFGLLVVGGRREQLDGAIKYVGLNLIATLAFLTGVGLLYGATGALNMADLHQQLQGRQDETAVLGAAALLLFAFGAKAALFPVYFWLPAAYHTPGFATSALFSALLTKVGVYAIFRVFTLVFDVEQPEIRAVLMTAALITMVAGVCGALVQNHIRRVLSFSVIASLGFMILGLAIHTELAIAASVFYMFQDILVKAALFLMAGIVYRLTGSEEFDKVGGIWKARPWLAVLFLIPALSLSGIPPLSGFWAKLMIVQSSLAAVEYFAAFLALAVGLLTLWAMARIWLGAFWDYHPLGGEGLDRAIPVPMLLPILLLVAATIWIGVNAAPFVDFALAISAEVLDPSEYVAAVLGGGE
jgi:multicomponent Na+:H+ antiporter subunit D